MLAWREDARPVVRASALGGCTRALALALAGVEGEPAPQWMEDVFERGWEAEEQIVKMLADRGLTVTRQQEEYDLKLGVGVVRGHVDGFIGGRIVEIKSTTDIGRMKTGRLADRYRWQISAGLPTVFEKGYYWED